MTAPELPVAIDTAGRDAAEQVKAWAGKSRGELARLGLEARRTLADSTRHEAALEAAPDGVPMEALAALDRTLGAAWQGGRTRLDQVRQEAALVVGAAAQQASTSHHHAGGSRPNPPRPDVLASLPEILEPRPPVSARELWDATPPRAAVAASDGVAEPVAAQSSPSSPRTHSSDDEAFWQDMPETDSVFARLRRLERRPR